MAMAEKSVPQQIPRAHDILDTELARTTNERDALRQFRARYTEIDPTTPSPQDISSGLTGVLQSVTPGTGNQSSRSDALDQIYNAYQETVMATPHYDSDYDESLDENLREEVGEELASAITTGEHFSPQIKQSLEQAIQQCIAARRVLLDDLDREAEALETAETTITEIRDWLREHNARPLTEWSLTERYRTHERLCEYEAECDALAGARQETLQTKRVTARRADSRLFNAYCYDSLGVGHPVLADLATLGELLREARQRLEGALMPRTDGRRETQVWGN